MMMNFIYLTGIICLLVLLTDGRRIEKNGEDIFDLAGFLDKVLTTVKQRNKYPPIGSINARPQAASIGVSSVQGQCNDFATWCPNYKTYCGYSQVKQYCPQTCNLCPKPTKKPTTPPPKENKCENTHTQCDLGVQYGYCLGTTAQLNFMKKYCRKACNFCTTCEDLYEESYCQQRLNEGLCKKSQYRSFFKKNCAKTCGFCGDETQAQCGTSKLRLAGDKKVDVVGGRNALKGYYPWQTAIYYENEFICGGTLINNKYILTAAHCFNARSTDVRKYKIVLGEHHRASKENTEETYYLEQIKIHERYSTARDDHDIALLKVVPEVEFTDLIQPACLPAENSEVTKGTKCYLSGWGKTGFDGEAVDILQEVEVPVVSNEKCKIRNAFNFHEVTNKMICTGYNNGHDFSSGCHGDSGGPLSCERSPGIWTLEGVVSWGSPLCNGLDRYTVYTRVSSYKSWIDSNTSN